jgi:hypothetical protein
VGVLDESEGAELEAHLASCPDCGSLGAVVDGALADLDLAKETAPDVWAKVEGELDRLEGRAPVVALACTYCKDQLVREKAVFCARCLAPHHEECFLEHGRCSSCREKRFVSPSAPAVPRWQRVARPILLLAFGAGAAAAVAWGLGPRLAANTVAEGPRAATPESGEPSREPAPVEPRKEPAVALFDLVLDRAQPASKHIAFLSAEPGKPYIFTNAPDLLVELPTRKVTWDEALSLLAEKMGARVVHPSSDVQYLDVEPRVNLSCTGRPLEEIVRELARVGGKQLVFEVNSVPITLDLRDVTWFEALETVARSAAVSISMKGDVIVVSQNPFEWGTQDLGNGLDKTLAVVRGPTGVATSVTRTTAACRNLVVASNATSLGMARLLAISEGRNIVLPSSPQVPGARLSVTFRLEDVPWIDALKISLGVNGWGVVTDAPRTLRVCSVEESDNSVTPWTGPLPAEQPRTEVLSLPGYFRGLKVEALAVDRMHGAPARVVLGAGYSHFDFVLKAGDVLGVASSDEGFSARVVSIDAERMVLERDDTGSRWEISTSQLGVPIARVTRQLSLTAGEAQALADEARSVHQALVMDRRHDGPLPITDWTEITNGKIDRILCRLRRAHSDLVSQLLSDFHLDDAYEGGNLDHIADRIAQDLEEARHAATPELAADALEDATIAVELLDERGARARGRELLKEIRELEKKSR